MPSQTPQQPPQPHSDNPITDATSCPVCGSTSQYVFEVGEYPVNECSDCRHRFVAQRFGADHTVTTYSDNYFEGGGAGYTDYPSEEQLIRDHGRRYGAIVNKHMPPGRMLDVGAAAGFIMKGFADEGWVCDGIEPNAQMARVAEESGFKLNVSSLEDFTPDETYDLVSMIQVVPHFHNLRLAAEHAAKLVKPGGYWLVETWNHRSWTARILGRHWHEYSPPTVLHFFCGKSLDHLAKQNGMTPVTRGRPQKYLQGQHAKSLLTYCLNKSFLTKPLGWPLRLLPDKMRLWYPSEDLMWVLYRSQPTSPTEVTDVGKSTTIDLDSTTERPAKMHYGNFSDPKGLILRMLRSGQRPAYAGLIREAVKIPLMPVDWLASKLQRKPKLKSNAEATPQSQHPIILIVGPPRSGSTLVYQVISRFCEVTYPDNLNSLFPRSSLLAMKWMSRTTPPKKAALRSCYGQTSRLCDPNEGFYLWDQWLGTDRYTTAESLSTKTISEMNAFFATWTDHAGKPFVNKNNRSTACIELLSKCLTNSYFVVVQRDDRDIVRSIIRGREFVQGDRRKPWGLDSQDTHATDDPLGYINDVCEQVQRISATINRHIQSVDEERVVSIPYQEFCKQPHSMLTRIADTVPGLKLRDELISKELVPFRLSTGNLLSEPEEIRIDQCLGLNE